MPNITLLYYTANKIPEKFAKNIREHLLWSSKGKPIISISQQPMDFGKENIHAIGLVPNMYNIYIQIVMGAEKAKTKYVACCEDDVLYCQEHFDFEPTERAFYYNNSVRHLRPKGYYCNENILMSQCIVERDYLLETFALRFKKFTTPESIVGSFGEPGREEHLIGLPKVEGRFFQTEIYPIIFHHRYGISGVRVVDTEIVQELPHWGKANELWEKYYN